MSRYSELHKNPQGENDARPSALKIVEDENLLGKLGDKTFLVTGCSSGIGIETARALHATGADVYFTTRDAAKGAKVLEEIRSTSSGSGELHHLELELAHLQSVREAAASFLEQSRRLNAIIFNAGVMACPEGKTKDGFETQLGVNHLAHFLLFQLLKPTLLASSTPEFNSRVVAVSSSGHRGGSVQFDDLNFENGYNKWKAYAQSKTAMIWTANEIERRFGSKGLHGLSLNPGGIWTPLQRHTPELKEQYGSVAQVQAYMKSPEQGAATSVYAALSKDWEGRGGKYLEDCDESPKYEGSDAASIGWVPHAFDAANAKKLYDLSLKLVGLPPEVESES
ncbi:hypothetical protein WJX73_005824 [Symbiochloris irregularis]|uniref:Uncharacterized protein n=1 Tax=Symbiochloris irregularis TaxID=706552 RepID=A0AAW1P1Z3_9CHLO